jgi:hypothetical protein
MPFTAQDCRAKAVECERRAASTNYFELKVQSHELAKQWRSLADQAERRAAEQTGENDRCQLAGSDWSGRQGAGHRRAP